jgi:uncharacterized protein
MVNLRHLEEHEVRMEGELPVEELELNIQDELIKAVRPLEYDFEVQEIEQSLLLQGKLSLSLECECARCLKPFKFQLKLEPWTVHVPLQGEEAAPVVSDCVDLTPYVREDILLEFPQHPLCDPECHGLPKSLASKDKHNGNASPSAGDSPAWSELNKLKF